jgi:hypothetical protein
MSIGVWILSIHVDFCDPNMDIAFDEEKPNVYFVNSMAIVVWIPSIHIGFCDPNVDIAFEEEKLNVRLMNSMGYCSLNTFNPYRFLWPPM